MKTLALVLLLLGLVAPGIAGASLELGTSSAIGLNLEYPRWSIGLGLDVRWQVLRDMGFVGGEFYRTADVTLIVLEPAATARFFLSADRKLQPFIVTRIQHEIPITSSNWDLLADQVSDHYDSWRLGAGGGLRAELNDRFAIGGEVLARTRLIPVEHLPTQVAGAADFLVFVQYRP